MYDKDLFADDETEDLFKRVLAYDYNPNLPYQRVQRSAEKAFNLVWLEKCASTVDDNGLPVPWFIALFQPLPYYPEMTQDDARLAARFITWLGTACGAAFLRNCRDMAAGRKEHYQGTSYLLAWANENKRTVGINNGFRTIEYLIAEAAHYAKHYLTENLELSFMPDVTMRQIDIIERLVEWLASSEGKAFVQEAEERYEKDRWHKF